MIDAWIGALLIGISLGLLGSGGIRPYRTCFGVFGRGA